MCIMTVPLHTANLLAKGVVVPLKWLENRVARCNGVVVVLKEAVVQTYDTSAISGHC